MQTHYEIIGNCLECLSYTESLNNTVSAARSVRVVTHNWGGRTHVKHRVVTHYWGGHSCKAQGGHTRMTAGEDEARLQRIGMATHCNSSSLSIGIKCCNVHLQKGGQQIAFKWLKYASETGVTVTCSSPLLNNCARGFLGLPPTNFANECDVI